MYEVTLWFRTPNDVFKRNIVLPIMPIIGDTLLVDGKDTFVKDRIISSDTIYIVIGNSVSNMELN